MVESLRRALVLSVLVLLAALYLTIRLSSHRPSTQRVEDMSAALKVLSVAPRAKHTATIIFVHVRHNNTLTVCTNS